MYVNSKEEIAENLFILYANAIIEKFNLPKDKVFVAEDAINIIGVEPVFQFIFEKTKQEYETAQTYIYEAEKIEAIDRFSTAKRKLQLQQGQLLIDLYWPRLMACYRVMHNDNGINYSFVEETNGDNRITAKSKDIE